MSQFEELQAKVQAEMQNRGQVMSEIANMKSTVNQMVATQSQIIPAENPAYASMYTNVCKYVHQVGGSTYTQQSASQHVPTYSHPTAPQQFQGNSNSPINWGPTHSNANLPISAPVTMQNPMTALLKLNFLEQKLLNSDQTLTSLRNDIIKLKEDVSTVKLNQTEDRQYSRRYNLLFFGLDDVPVTPEKPNQEYRSKFAEYVVNKLNALFPNIIGMKS